MASDKHLMQVSLKPDDIQWVIAQSEALGVSRAAYVTMLIRKDRTGVVPPAAYRQPLQAVYADPELQHSGATEEFDEADPDEVFHRAMNAAEAQGAMDERPQVYETPVSHGEVRRVGPGSRNGHSPHGLPPAGRFAPR